MHPRRGRGVYDEHPTDAGQKRAVAIEHRGVKARGSVDVRAANGEPAGAEIVDRRRDGDRAIGASADNEVAVRAAAKVHGISRAARDHLAVSPVQRERIGALRGAYDLAEVELLDLAKARTGGRRRSCTSHQPSQDQAHADQSANSGSVGHGAHGKLAVT